METGVARRDDLPAVGQLIVSDAAVENQRVGRDLQPLLRSRQLVEEQDPGRLFRGRQELGRKPHGLAEYVIGVNGTANVHRLNRREPKIDQRYAEMLGDLPHDRGLAHAAGAPEHRGTAPQHGIGVLLDQGGFRGRDRHRRYVPAAAAVAGGGTGYTAGTGSTGRW